MKIRTKILGGFLIITMLTIFLGAIVFINTTEVDRSFTFLVEHDLEVLQNAQKLQKLVVDAETGQRGFVITGDENFLEPYKQGIQGFNSLIRIEKKLVSDNPSQVQRLKNIQVLFDEWNLKAAQPEIAAARNVHQSTNNLNDLEDLLAEGTGKKILDELRILLTESIKREQEEEEELEQELLLVEISKDLLDRESGQRGFLITGEEEFLEPYNLGNENLEKHLNELQVMVKEEEEGVDEVDIVNKIIELSARWEKEAAIPEIEARRTIDQNPTIFDVASMVKVGTGKIILDEIRKEFTIFIQVENDLKNERLSNVTTISEFTEILLILLPISIAIVAVSIAIIFTRTISKPLEILKHACVKVSKGDLETKIEIYSKKDSSTDEIKELTEYFNKMVVDIKKGQIQIKNQLNELKKVDSQKDEFAAMVSHELKTPHVPIQLYTEMLLKGVLGEIDYKQTKALRSMHSNIESLKGLVDDVLDVTKLEVGRLTLHKKQVDLKTFLNENIDSLKPFTYEKKTKLQLELRASGKIFCDPKRITQIISNLIKNSIDFIPKDTGIVKLIVEKNEKSILFTITDNGPGIPKENQEFLFQKFYKIDTSPTRKHGGTGLGLTICEGLVEAHGGKIWLDEKYTQGTCFKFTIPEVKP